MSDQTHMVRQVTILEDSIEEEEEEEYGDNGSAGKLDHQASG